MDEMNVLAGLDVGDAMSARPVGDGVASAP